MTKSRAALLSLILSFLILPVEAATYYVSTKGNDTPNNGSELQPWRTIGKAASLVNPGDTVIIQPGTYREEVTLTRSGTASNPITWTGIREGPNWMTIIDPSVDASTGWVPAPEVAPGVFKHTALPFQPYGLFANGGRVWQLTTQGDDSTITNTSQCLDLLKPAANATINAASGYWTSTMPYWDGVEASWVWHEGVAYLRFRNGDDPNGKSIRISFNDAKEVGAQSRAAFKFKSASFNTLKNLHIRGMHCAIALRDFANDNTLEENYLEHGQFTVFVGDSASRNTIRRNEIVASMYGFNDFGPWSGYDTPTELVKKRWRAYAWPKKHEYALTPKAILVRGDGPDNRVMENHVHHGSVGIGMGFHSDIPPATGLIVASNFLHNLSSVGLTIDGGNTDTKVHDNFVHSANIAFRWQNFNVPQTPARLVYFFRNRSWMEGTFGIHNYWHHLNEGGTEIPEVWYYHNSFLGGWRWSSFLDIFLSYRGLSKVRFVNNIISSATTFGASSEFLLDANAIGAFDYNLVRGSSINATWAGPNNFVDPANVWSLSQEMPSLEVDGVAKALKVGLDLSRSFTLRGLARDPLPGMMPGYFAGNAPDLGAIQSGSSIPKLPTDEGPNEPIATFLASLDATDALLLDSYMSLQSANVQKTSTTQATSPAYIVSSSPDRGWAHFHPTLPTAGNYTIWCRVMTTGSEADSFYVSINGSTERIFESRTWAPVWHWTRLGTFQASQPESIEYAHYLRSSVNEISFRCRDAYTMLSRLLITNDAEFIPAEVAANRVAVRIRRTNYGQILKWPSTAGTPYHVLYSPDFKSHPWTVAGEPIVAGGPETEWLAPKSQLDTGFYWVHAGM